MALNEAEELVKAAKERIAKIKAEGAGEGSVDDKLEKALKENKYL